MEFKKQIIKSLAKAIEIGETEIQLQATENKDFGDYSSNVAMVAFGKLKNEKTEKRKNLAREQFDSSRDLASDIVTKLKSDKELGKVVDRIDVAGPGFINFFLKKEILVDTLVYISSHKETFGYSLNLKGKRLMLEFGQPNTHKSPHIGHLFSYVLGYSLSNLLEASGVTVKRVNYQGDVGPHVAKCLWAFKKEKNKIPRSLKNKVDLLQKMYQMGSKAYDENEKAKEEINAINKKIFAKDPEWMSLWEETRSWNVEYYKDFEERLGVRYDRYYFESEVYMEGKKIVEANVGKVFKKSEGAIIFEGSKYGLHDRVFVTKYGTSTYEAKDLYLENLKMKDWPMDELLITTANEQNEYFKVVYKALEVLDPKFKGKLKHIGFGMVNLTTGKMSSRTGEFVGAVELVDITVQAVKELIANRAELADEAKNKIAEIVGLGAIKYAFLKSNPLQNIKFDIKESISLEGNSGPYLQYTYARTRSVEAKSTFKGGTLQGVYSNLELNKDETSVLRAFIHFPEVVAEAAEKYSPNILCNYLYDLAQKYNSFYNKYPILEQRTMNKEQSEFRLALTSATGQILKTGLNLLGIQAPNKM